MGTGRSALATSGRSLAPGADARPKAAPTALKPLDHSLTGEHGQLRRAEAEKLAVDLLVVLAERRRETLDPPLPPGVCQTHMKTP